MQRSPQRLLIVLAVVCLMATAMAQAPPGSLRAPGGPAPLVVEDLGLPTVRVDGLWAFHPGDDLAWAAPGYDDSGWARIETGKTWEEQGFLHLTGFGWYRRNIVLDTGTNSDWQLGVMLPDLEDAAEVYWNGRLVGSDGKLPPDPVWYGNAYTNPSFPAVFDLGRAGAQPKIGVLAIRVWTAPYVFFSAQKVGGLTTVPEIGSAEAIRDQLGRQSGAWLKNSLYGLGLALVEGILALLALLAWLRDRRQWMLFWLALYMAHAVLMLPFSVPGLMSFRWSYGLVAPAVCVEDVSLWFLLLYLLQLRDDRRLVRWTVWMTAVALVGNFGDAALQLFQWTTWPGHVFLAWDVGLSIPALLVETWVLVLVGFAFRRKLDAASRLLAIAATLVDVIQAVADWGDAGARWTHWNVGWIKQPLFTTAGNAFTPANLADTLLLVAILYAVWRYQAEQSRKQSLLDEEFRNAQELQQVLVPQNVPEVDGFTVTSAYLPAQVVGGDFFQIIPLGEGQALAVVGDVSGKGLRAAMTVSLIVGALRSLVRTTSAPGKILAGLNDMLQGRLHSGFATCVVLRLEADGACVVANAGHLPPFLNGQEMDLPGALPLGLSAEAEYTETAVTLKVGDRLTLYTDGLLEARNEQGELFGFARVATLFAALPDANAAAEAAVRFGQDDDVTVVSICHVGGRASRMRSAAGLAAAADGVTA